MLAHPEPTVAVYREGLERSQAAATRLQATLDELLVDARLSPLDIDVVAAGLPAQIVWDNQMWMLNMWSIPKGGSNAELARDFIAFASRPENMAEQTKHIPYAPVRQSALELVPEEIAQTLPTYPENFANALKFDASWWADHGDRTENRFTSWLAR